MLAVLCVISGWYKTMLNMKRYAAKFKQIRLICNKPAVRTMRGMMPQQGNYVNYLFIRRGRTPSHKPLQPPPAAKFGQVRQLLHRW